MKLRHLSVSLLAISMVAAGCLGEDETTGPPATETTIDPATQAQDAGDSLSMVVIGDSVAAGEGIAYGYEYDYDSSDPDRSGWTGGMSDPTWQGQYQLCHQDEKAYGELVAADLDANLAKFACTGATYLDGITTLQNDEGEQLRPAQFGNWTEKSQLNADYDEAHPDVVVLTFGADDVDFVGIMEFCVSGFTTADSDTVDAMAAADDVSAAIDESLSDKLVSLTEARAHNDPTRQHDSSDAYCTEANPGAPIDKLFWDPINSGEIAQHYKDMVGAIQERGKDPGYGDGNVPEIVFTTYHRPLPAGLDGDCWDVWPLSSAEQSYLNSLQEKLQQVLEDAVGDMDGVHIADISKSMDGHRWCSEDPWVYGLSVIWTDLAIDSQAPFHPTPEGQQAIAEIVGPVVRSAAG